MLFNEYLISMQLHLDIPKERSSLISKLEYDDELYLLKVHLRYLDNCLWYSEVFPNHFEEFYKTDSIGKYYLHFIKVNFKQLKLPKMAERPKTKNEASSEKRFIKININVDKIIKEWLLNGEKGRYLSMTLQMLPDGKLDQFGNLGMITQDVPKFVYEKEKNMNKGDRTKGPILGNAAELVWESANEVNPGDTATTEYEGPYEDLPF